jgi:hypothetical protein
MGDQPYRKATTYTGQRKHRTNADIHASSGTRTHDPSVRAGEDISCLRPRGHCDRLLNIQRINSSRIQQLQNSYQVLIFEVWKTVGL